LSLDQSYQSDSPNGKISSAVLFPLMPNRHFLVKFWKCQKAVSILPQGKSTAGAILPSTNRIWLKAK